MIYKICPQCLFEKQTAQHDKEFRKMTRQKHVEYIEFLRRTERESMFPSELRTWNRYCPAHQYKLESDAMHISSRRYIPVEWFDVYGDDKKRVCRACGSQLLTKKGKHHPMLRWCLRKDIEHQKLVSQTLFSFASSRLHYIINLAEKQVPLIREHHADLIKKGTLVLRDRQKAWGERIYYQYSCSRVVMCEKCGVLATPDMIHCSPFAFAQVHHKIPVCLVTLVNVMSIFDENNLICLCNACHGKSHPWRKKPVEPAKKYKNLDAYIKKR